jgi:hypothetical protein
LFDIVATLDLSCRLPNRLHRWQEKANKNADNCDNHQQLDQRHAKSSHSPPLLLVARIVPPHSITFHPPTLNKSCDCNSFAVRFKN